MGDQRLPRRPGAVVAVERVHESLVAVRRRAAWCPDRERPGVEGDGGAELSVVVLLAGGDGQRLRKGPAAGRVRERERGALVASVAVAPRRADDSIVAVERDRRSEVFVGVGRRRGQPLALAPAAVAAGERVHGAVVFGGG